ncbi:hypothetical protein BDN67DRAFT_983126 [Paxillus ammoniavirescens]|nr:hypothetical protein BDN67DRAFT_983126 [Paxillus ammoniavirescens]
MFHETKRTIKLIVKPKPSFEVPASAPDPLYKFPQQHSFYSALTSTPVQTPPLANASHRRSRSSRRASVGSTLSPIRYYSMAASPTANLSGRYLQVPLPTSFWESERPSKMGPTFAATSSPRGRHGRVLEKGSEGSRRHRDRNYSRQGDASPSVRDRRPAQLVDSRCDKLLFPSARDREQLDTSTSDCTIFFDAVETLNASRSTFDAEPTNVGNGTHCGYDFDGDDFPDIDSPLAAKGYRICETRGPADILDGAYLADRRPLPTCSDMILPIECRSANEGHPSGSRTARTSNKKSPLNRPCPVHDDDPAVISQVGRTSNSQGPDRVWSKLRRVYKETLRKNSSWLRDRATRFGHSFFGNKDSFPARQMSAPLEDATGSADARTRPEVAGRRLSKPRPVSTPVLIHAPVGFSGLLRKRRRPKSDASDLDCSKISAPDYLPKPEVPL